MISTYIQLKWQRIFGISVIITLLTLVVLISWAQPQGQPSPKEQQKQLENMLKKAQEYYKNAEFGMAGYYYKEALKLSPNDVDIQKKLEDTEAKQQIQKELSAPLPRDPLNKQALLEKKYDAARNLYSNDKYEEARKEFLELWIMAGPFKKTMSYLDKIDKELKEQKKEQEKAAQKKAEAEKEKTTKKDVEKPTVKKSEVDNLVQKGKQALADGNLDKANSYFVKALEIDKDNKAAAEGIIQVNEAKIKQQKSVTTQESPKAKEERESAAAKEEEKKKAEQIKLKKKVDSAIAKANKYLASGKYEKANDYYMKAIDLDKDNKMAAEGLIKVQEAQAREKAAQLKQEIAEQKKKAQSFVDKGNQSLAKSDYDDAIDYFQKALELDKENPKALAGILRATQDQQQRQLDENNKQEIQKKVKDGLDKAESLYKKGDLENALAQYKSVLSMDPQNKTAQKSVASIQDELKEKQQEQKKEQQRTADLEQFLKQAKALMDSRKYADAAAAYKKALSLDTQNKEAQQGLDKAQKMIESEKKKQDDAVAKKAEEQKKQQDVVSKHIDDGEKALKEGDFTSAIRAFTAAIGVDATNQRAKEGLAKAQNLQKDAQKKEIELAEAKKAEQEKKLAEQKLKEEQQKKETEEKLKEEQRLQQEKTKAEEEQKKKEAEDKLKEEQKLQQEKAQAEEEKKKTEDELKKQQEQKAAQEQQIKKEMDEIERIKKEQEQKAADLIEKGKGLYDKEKYEEALAAFNEALGIQPLNLEAQKMKTLAEEKIAEARRQEQIRLEEEMKKRDMQQRADALFSEAETLLKNNQFDMAVAKLNEALQVMPGWDKATKKIDEINAAKTRYQKEQADKAVKEGMALYNNQQYNLAIEKFNEALRLEPTNETASRYITMSMEKMAEMRKQEERQQLEAKKSEALRLFKEGMTAYQQKNLEEAVSKWEQSLKVYPEFQDAASYLEKTKVEYQQYMQAQAEKEAFQTKEQRAQEKLNTLVNIETKKPISLRDFLKNLYIITDIDFYVAEGVEASIEAKFEDKPLHEVLDTVLLPIGLKWERKPGTDIVVVSPDLTPRVFELTPSQLTKIKALMDSKFIQRMLWGASAEPSLKGVEITLDERESVLIIVDSKKNVEKMEAFIRDLQKEAPPELIWKSYKIDPQNSDKIMAILEAMLEIEKPTPYSRERRILISGDELVIKDIPENVKRAEEILTDREFIKKIKEEKLVAEVFDITPEGATQENIAQVEDFGKYVKTVVENMLYAKTGRTAAESEGRRLWLRSYIEPPDMPKLTMTVVDYPSNIEAVADLVARLPEVKKGMRSEIIFLKYARAADMSAYLETVLGITEGPSYGGPGGDEITKTMRVEDEVVFRDLSIRLTRVEENDVADENDDSAEFVVRTGTTSEDVTIDEYRSEFVDDYEIIAEDVKPSGTPGQGRVRVRIRYAPTATVQETPTPTPAAVTEGEEEEEIPLTIEPFEDLNALLIQYTDTAKYSEVKRWIEQLDLPSPQVSIDARFIEVIESKAREYSADLIMDDLTGGLDMDSSLFNLRFAQIADEFRDVYEPFPELARSANLLKGTTVLNLLMGGGSNLSWQLRLLEAEGVINIVNSPTITVINGESADFTIERQFGLPEVTGEGQYAAGATITSLIQSDLSVTPTITQLGSITLDIDCEIRDFDTNLGGVDTRDGYEAVTNSPASDPAILRKDITTICRVQDGGTIVLGGWTGERSGEYHSGIPILRNLPYVGQVLFGRNLRTVDKTTLLIFLTATLVK